MCIRDSTIAAATLLVPSIHAQNGVTASPRLRQQVNERQTVMTKTSVPVRGNSTIVASPKLQQQLTENKPVSGTVAGHDTISTTARSDNGIAASPRLREQLHLAKPEFRIAPIK